MAHATSARYATVLCCVPELGACVGLSSNGVNEIGRGGVLISSEGTVRAESMLPARLPGVFLATPPAVPPAAPPALARLPEWPRPAGPRDAGLEQP
eukprot:15464910-Alexandrium_andersonii.AAC.1